MLEVGGQPILAHQVAALRASGVTQIAVVTGFCAETIHTQLGDGVAYIHNADFATTNSIYSLWLSREHLAPGGLILNSDVLFHPRALGTLIGDPRPNCLLFDPDAGHGDPEAMKIAIDDSDGSIERLSKALPDAKTRGENLGVIRLDAEGAAVAAETLDAMIASDIRHAWVPEVINEMRPRVRVHPVAVGAPWIEIDTPEDLERARIEIWPRLGDSVGG
jgi:choline kinase